MPATRKHFRQSINLSSSKLDDIGKVSVVNEKRKVKENINSKSEKKK